MLATTAQTFREFLERQDIFVFFITIYVGAGLIANDRRANALQIYLSKPLTRLEYVAGKAATLAVFLLGVTWVPAMLLLAVQAMFAGNFAFIRAQRVPAARRSRSTPFAAGDAGDLRRCWRCRRCRRARGSSASCTPASIFFTDADLRRC